MTCSAHESSWCVLTPRLTGVSSNYFYWNSIEIYTYYIHNLMLLHLHLLCWMKSCSGNKLNTTKHDVLPQSVCLVLQHKYLNIYWMWSYIWWYEVLFSEKHHQNEVSLYLKQEEMEYNLVSPLNQLYFSDFWTVLYIHWSSSTPKINLFRKRRDDTIKTTSNVIRLAVKFLLVWQHEAAGNPLQDCNSWKYTNDLKNKERRVVEGLPPYVSL